MNTRRAVYQILQHLRARGVTHLPAVTIQKPQPAPTQRTRSEDGGTAGHPKSPVGSTASGRNQQTGSARTSHTGNSSANPSQRTLMPQTEQHNAVVRSPDLHAATLTILNQPFVTVEEKSAALNQLAGFVSSCTRCADLANTRRQTVFGVGDPNARIMFIGEAPGADEDVQGEPFVGKAGQLLDKIISACQLTRSEIYICNVLRCRPPGNRTPLPQEAANCREFLDAQIHVVQPEYIVCWGSVAAQNLLQDKRPISKMRGQFMSYKNAKVLCTYHPSYLLRNPAAKPQVWEDMKLLMREMGVELK